MMIVKTLKLLTEIYLSGLIAPQTNETTVLPQVLRILSIEEHTDQAWNLKARVWQA